MADKVYNVLFLCTGNSARSILGEAILNQLAISSGKFKGYSAGSHPKGEVNPWTLETLCHNKFPVAGLRSKSWDEFAAAGAPQMDFVFTVCDQAAAEPCPYWPGQPMTAHWGLRDPAAVEGNDEDQRRAFRDTLMALRRRIEVFTSLPLDKLDRIAIQKRVKEIGETQEASALKPDEEMVIQGVIAAPTFVQAPQQLSVQKVESADGEATRP